MKTRTALFFFLLLTICNSCSKKSPYPGFSSLSENIWYKLYQIGENEKRPVPGDYVTVDIIYKTMRDSAFFSGRRKFQLNETGIDNLVNTCLTSLSSGDSAAFILDAESFFQNNLETNLPSFFNAGDKLIMVACLREIQTQEEYIQEKQAFLKWIDDFSEYEKEILLQFMEGKKLKIEPTASGLYYLRLIPGNGKKVSRGDTLTVDYEGKFLNGKFFDSTIKRNESFLFVYGTEWQVVEGLEEGIGMMEEGEKALFILPSGLAFGNEGSSTGIIPPYTSLIFEVELKKVVSGVKN
ncbi:MAG: FKBP-type peptidyl-prolyl cis-trans isomerase [Bacteroidales bacterium]